MLHRSIINQFLIPLLSLLASMGVLVQGEFIFTGSSVLATQALRRIEDQSCGHSATTLYDNVPAASMQYFHTSPNDVLDFLHVLEELKIRKRTGWHIEGVPYVETESIAGHMYRMGIITQLIDVPAHIDRSKMMVMALVHDMAEAIVGDITLKCEEFPNKEHLETVAMSQIRTLLAGNPFGAMAEALWKEYTEDATAEAQLVKDIDKAELYVQVLEYETRFDISFQHWIDNARPKIRHPALRDLVDAAEERRPEKFKCQSEAILT